MNILDSAPNGSFNSGADTPFNRIGTSLTSMVSPSRTWVTNPVCVLGSAAMPGVINTPDTANTMIEYLMQNAYHTLFRPPITVPNIPRYRRVKA